MGICTTVLRLSRIICGLLLVVGCVAMLYSLWGKEVRMGRFVDTLFGGEGVWGNIWYCKDKRYYLCVMKAIKYTKVDQLPINALSVSSYAQQIGQKNPSYICVMYDRYVNGKGSYPNYNIVNWQGINFVIPDNG